MAIEIIKVSASKTKPKATIHLTGKLGFNMEASNLMKLQGGKLFHFAKETEDEGKFYLIEGMEADGAVKVSKAGQYFYLNLPDAFDKVGLNYKEETIMFDITEDLYHGKPMYILKKRKSIPRKKN